MLFPVELCQKLGISYQKRGSYVAHIKTQWRHDIKSGRGPTCPTFHNWRGAVYVPKGINRPGALSCGWVQSRNQNKGFIWKDQLGRLEWFETGRVKMWLRKPASEGRLAQLLTAAFYRTALIPSFEVFEKFRKIAWYQGAHAVYEMGEKLPYRRITDFRDDNGIVVTLGDLSHQTAVELEFYRPTWAQEMRETTQAFIESVKELREELRDAVTGIKELKDPSRLKGSEPERPRDPGKYSV
jgi:hypothetical protein